MTTGQRIAACRKERGLSQEELGAQLGVSRQSIYKWESDASLPEVEKLVALSRLFGVSVGWLLGVEEERTPSGSASDALNETQLKMVEEIVERYIAAQPKPEPRKSRRWPYIVAVCAVLAVLLSISMKLNRMNNQYQILQNNFSAVQNSVDSEISGISDRVEAILKSQNNLTADYHTELLSTDPAQGTATFSVRAIPKTYTTGMQAVFSAATADSSDAGSTVETAGTLGSNQEFSAELTCPLTDQISINVTFLSNETRETQLIGEYTSLYTNSLPASNYSLYDDRILLTEVSSTGKVTLNNIYFTLILDAFPVESAAVNSATQPAATASLRVGLFLNQKLVAWAQPCSQPAGYTGDYNADFYALPNMELTLKESDRLATAVVATDNYGRCVVYPSAPYQWCKETSDLRWSDDHYDSPSDSDDWSF